MVHFLLRPADPGGVPDLVSAAAAPSASWRGFRSSCSCSWCCTLGVRADPVGADRALPRHPRHPGEPADVLVLRDADHLSVPRFDGDRRQMRDALNLNPFTHLAITYQEILFFEGPGRPLHAGCCVLGVRLGRVLPVRLLRVRSACATRLRRKCERDARVHVHERHRAHQRLEDLPPLRPAAAVRDAEERAAVAAA